MYHVLDFFVMTKGRIVARPDVHDIVSSLGTKTQKLDIKGTAYKSVASQ